MSAPAERVRVGMLLWRRAFMSQLGGLQPTTRLVLNGLAIHMNDEGDECFPSVRLQSDETGLTERTVCTHLELAAEQGWIERRLDGRRGRDRALMRYRATIPAAVREALSRTEELPQGEIFDPEDLQRTPRATETDSVSRAAAAEAGSVPQRGGTESLSGGTESDDNEALKEVQSNSPENSSGNSPAPPTPPTAGRAAVWSILYMNPQERAYEAGRQPLD